MTSAVPLVQLLAVAGALLLGRPAGRWGAKRTVLGALVAWTATVSVAFARPAHGPVWFFVLAAATGMVLGARRCRARCSRT